MDLNRLFADHQNALFNARTAPTARERQGFDGQVANFAGQLRAYRERRNLPPYRWA